MPEVRGMKFEIQEDIEYTPLPVAAGLEYGYRCYDGENYHSCLCRKPTPQDCKNCKHKYFD